MRKYPLWGGALIVAGQLGLPLIGAAPAGASPSGAAGPAKLAPSAAPASLACSWSAHFTVTAEPPVRSGAGIRNRGVFNANQVSCTPPFGIVKAQTKACGFFGCDWENRGSSEEFIMRTTYETRNPYQDCRNGTNRYRTLARLLQPLYGGGSSTTLVTDDKQPEFTC